MFGRTSWRQCYFGRDLFAAVPFQRNPANHQLGAGGGWVWQFIPGNNAGCGKHNECNNDRALLCYSRLQYGTADYSAVLLLRIRWPQCSRALEREPSAARILHALYSEWKWRSVSSRYFPTQQCNINTYSHTHADFDTYTHAHTYSNSDSNPYFYPYHHTDTYSNSGG